MAGPALSQLDQLLPIEIVPKGFRVRVISPRLFQYTQQDTAGFTENSNAYIIVWDPTPPKADPDYWCLMSLLVLLVERPGENHRSATIRRQTLSRDVVWNTQPHENSYSPDTESITGSA